MKNNSKPDIQTSYHFKIETKVSDTVQKEVLQKTRKLQAHVLGSF